MEAPEVFADRFVPVSARESIDEHYRARSLVTVSITGGLVLMSFVLPRFVIHGIHPYPIILALVSLVCFLAPLILAKTSLKTAGEFLTLPLTIGLLVLCLVDGGVRSSTIFALPILPLIAIFFGSVWLGFVVIGLVSVAVVTMAVYADAAWILPMALPVTSMIYIHAFSAIGLAVVLVAFTLSFMRWQDTLREGLESANLAKNEFLSGMSHEIRTPLHSIMGFSDILKEEYLGKLTEKQKEHLGYILNSAEHLTRLVDDLLDISKIDSDQLVLNLEPMNVREVVQSVAISLGSSAEIAAIKIEDDLAPEFLILDETRFRQIVLNLVSNALKFTPSDGVVRIRVEQNGTIFELMVEDTGPGIEPDKQERVFERFFQAQASLSGKSQGSGLGLFISRRLAELHGATLSIDESYTDGCRIVFRLVTGSRL